MSLDVVILAAGQGTRMRSALPKVLHAVAGKPMLRHVVDAARALHPERIHVVIGHGADQVRQSFADAADLNFIIQEQQLGTGHAVAQAIPHIKGQKVLVLYGDVPLTEPETLQRLLAQLNESLAVLTVHLEDPSGYGRIVRNPQGAIQAIVEHKDASAEQRTITECNTGILAAPRDRLCDWLANLSNNNAQGEYYLTDIIAAAVAEGLPVVSEHPQHTLEVQGANDRIQLALLERYHQRTQAKRLMQQGVTLMDPERFDVRGEVQVGKDILIDINVVLEGRVIIEDGVQIGPGCCIKDSILRRNSVVKSYSHLEGTELGEQADCGPFARLRPGTVLKAKAHVGNFVELKNAVMGEGAKAGHLTYLGDAEIGARTNIGAGTITCNYDGANKHRTVMGEDVFIGSNSSLVAPVTLGDGATTGAGSTITQDVPEHTLALGRARQACVTGWKRPVKSEPK